MNEQKIIEKAAKILTDRYWFGMSPEQRGYPYGYLASDGHVYFLYSSGECKHVENTFKRLDFLRKWLKRLLIPVIVITIALICSAFIWALNVHYLIIASCAAVPVIYTLAFCIYESIAENFELEYKDRRVCIKLCTGKCHTKTCHC